ncbi:MAG: phosphoglycerate kinase [Parachlamydiaceae bacterium]|nr:phosphoglycerate kinase [Parachlamydiaceae bacterium]
MHKLTLRDLPLKGKKVLMRVDFNVPMDTHGSITDDSRIKASLPSIHYALEQDCSLILMSHLGRPKNKKVKELSLKPCAEHLAKLLNKNVTLAPDCIGDHVAKLANDLRPGDVLMLENLRFYPGEEDPKAHAEFVKSLAQLGDLYVNDAFGSAHRNHASTAAIADFFPNKAAAGFLLEKEIEFLGKTLNKPERPFVGIIGGAKISTKMGALQALLKKVDVLLIGGAMAHTFLKAHRISVGDSLYEQDYVYNAYFLMNESRRLNIPLLFPTDLLIAKSLEAEAQTKIIQVNEGIPEGWHGVDIGPKTIQQFKQALQNAKTVLWNGPLGIFEIEAFAMGTKTIAEAIANLKATTIVGGGDSIAAIYAAGVADKISHLSTGGGASLEYIEYGTLPGIEALSDAH